MRSRPKRASWGRRRISRPSERTATWSGRAPISSRWGGRSWPRSSGRSASRPGATSWTRSRPRSRTRRARSSRGRSRSIPPTASRASRRSRRRSRGAISKGSRRTSARSNPSATRRPTDGLRARSRSRSSALEIARARTTRSTRSSRRSLRFPAAALRAFRAVTGLRTTGFSLYGHARCLGARPGVGWLTRARHLVVLAPGYLMARECWTELALALVRDNPDTLVVTIDHSGFGDSAFLDTPPAREHQTFEAVARAILAWTELCGVAAFPTVLVGHSMAATGLFLLPDDAFGPHRARIILTPMFSHVVVRAPSTRVQDAYLAVMALLFRIPALYRGYFALRVRLRNAVRELTPERRRLMLAQALQLPSDTHIQMARALMYAVLPRMEPLRRAYFVLGANDPEATPEVCERACPAPRRAPRALPLARVGLALSSPRDHGQPRVDAPEPPRARAARGRGARRSGPVAPDLDRVRRDAALGGGPAAGRARPEARVVTPDRAAALAPTFPRTRPASRAPRRSAAPAPAGRCASLYGMGEVGSERKPFSFRALAAREDRGGNGRLLPAALRDHSDPAAGQPAPRLVVGRLRLAGGEHPSPPSSISSGTGSRPSSAPAS